MFQKMFSHIFTFTPSRFVPYTSFFHQNSSFIQCNKEIMPSKWQEHHPILYIDSSVI